VGINFDRIEASAGLKSGWTGGLYIDVIQASSGKQWVIGALNLFKIGDRVKAEFVKERSLWDGISQQLTHT
jgi:hypothetical protein